MTNQLRLKQIISFVVVPVLALLLLFFGDIDPENPKVTATLAVAILMATWWITEALPLAVTSLLPVALFPILGIMDGKAVSATYFNDTIFLFMGGFLVALAMERWELHKRIAYKILCITGVSPSRILLGFMAASFFLSMWISNTATAMMMLPIAMAIIFQLDKLMEGRGSGRFSIAILLGVAYSSSVGGVATLVGTPPNLSFARIFHIYFPELPEVSFYKWLIFALPLALSIAAFIWIYLYLVFRPAKGEWREVERDIFHLKLKEMGRTTREQKIVFVIFSLLALLWIFRADIELGGFTLPGWSGIFPESKYINDGTVAIFMAIILFIIPAGKGGLSYTGKRGMIMDWESAVKLPWSILLLFGGGFALATGFKESGLSLWVGSHFAGVASLHPFIVILIISLVMTFLTELTSNTATTEMMLPILAGIAVTTGLNPLMLMIPATISASMAFMMPVATPPNAIIFGTGRVSVKTMAKTGFVINIIGALIITLFVYLGSMFK